MVTAINELTEKIDEMKKERERLIDEFKKLQATDSSSKGSKLA